MSASTDLLLESLPHESSVMTVAIVGGGPAGLMAAEVLAAAGVHVELYDAMPSVGRKFLLAGRGGLNLTHSEPHAVFLSRYGDHVDQVAPWLQQFDAEALRRWAHELGVQTFVGSSGRVFPQEMKAAPLLRRWLQRLRSQGVALHARHRWVGWSEQGDLLLESPSGMRQRRFDAVVLALGGASWPRLGSDGAWQHILSDKGVAVHPLLASNGGFLAQWTDYFALRYAGQPLKSIAMAPAGKHGMRRGEVMVTADGLEGGLIYAWSAALRTALLQHDEACIYIDLLPDRDPAFVQAQVAWPRGSRSWSSHLGSRLGLRGAKLALLHECLPREQWGDPTAVAAAIKRVPVHLTGMRPIEEAISTAGGVAFEGVDEALMLKAMPGVFCAGEMLDWDAPTGGYLLTACLASGRVAGQGVLRWLGRAVQV